MTYNFDACIFDFDYTLGDSTEGIVTSVNHALEALGLPPAPHAAIRRTIGQTLPEMFRHLTSLEDDELARRFKQLFMAKADEVMTESTLLFDDTVAILSDLKAQGTKIGIVTTKYHHRIDAILEHFQISHLVDVIVGIDDVKEPKPHPESVFFALDQLGVPLHKTIYIGDSLVDAKTAASAGVRFIAVTTGTTEKDSFTNYPHLAVIGHLAELPAIVP